MSIRPSIFTLFGIDDFNADNFDSDILEQQVYISDEAIKENFDLSYVKDYAYDRHENEWRFYEDILYIGLHNPETKGLLGLIKSYDFDSTTFRALSTIYPEFFESGKTDIPVIEDELEKRLRRRRGTSPSCGGIEFQESWFYQQAMHELTPCWAYTAWWLLDSIGIETDPTEYKWMLVWEWC